MRSVLHSIIVILGLATVGCQAQSVSTGVVNMDVNVADFAAGIDTAENALLLDVRTDAEFASGGSRPGAETPGSSGPARQ